MPQQARSVGEFAPWIDHFQANAAVR